MNTIEGVLAATADGLSALQEERRAADPAAAAKIDAFLQQLQACMEGERSFVFVLDDPAGNSFVQNPFAPHYDPELIVTHYARTQEQNALLGIGSDELERDRERLRVEQAAVAALDSKDTDHVHHDSKWREEQARLSSMVLRPATWSASRRTQRQATSSAVPPAAACPCCARCRR